MSPEAVVLQLSTGVILGFSIAAPPGPINVTMAAQAARSWAAAASVGAGAVTADVVFFAMTYYGLTGLVEGTLGPALYLVGGTLMTYLGASTIRRARAPAAAKDWSQRSRFPYLIGLSIGLSNPFQIAWWLTVGLAFVSSYGLGIFLGFFSGIASWVAIYTAALRLGVNRYGRAYSVVTYLSAGVLMLFGIGFVYAGVTAIV